MTDQFETLMKSAIIDTSKHLERREERRSVLDSFKNNEMFKAKFQTSDDHLTASAKKKKAFNKVIRLHQAFSNKRLGDADDHSPACKTMKCSGRSGYRFSSVKADKNTIDNTRQNKMSMTNYGTGFRTKCNKAPSRSVMGGAYSSGDHNKMKLKTMKNTASLFYQKESFMAPFKTNKNKLGPEKIRPFLDYDFTQYQKPEPELTIDEPIAPIIQEPVKGKAPPPKGKEEPPQDKVFFKMSKNILFDKIDARDSDSDFGDPKFL